MPTCLGWFRPERAANVAFLCFASIEGSHRNPTLNISVGSTARMRCGLELRLLDRRQRTSATSMAQRSLHLYLLLTCALRGQRCIADQLASPVLSK